MRLVVVEDQYLLREGLVRLLQGHGIDVVAALADSTQVIETVERLEPDVTVLDIRLPPTYTDEGLRLARGLRGRTPGRPVLLLSQYVELLYLDELLEDDRGGVGYLLKDRVLDDAQFVDALRSVSAGGTVVDPDVVRRLIARQRQRGLTGRLSPRETEVLALMAEGDSNSVVARKLFITDKAVAKHINSIFTKLDLPPTVDSSRRVAAVLSYLRS
ncbi:MAG: response regulator transcription factor [Intrasporangium sp.]|uniref:response regulator n=1 Tax=Intrasporangium sp. TaxID=1925024 RepID=UPI0026494478|nr:response regulator transcription factor [Intrasporangium sp.]MDN5794435.1 response regulator transcription factor [Intrasporangium sp.]